jgi:hypothetical protein
VRAFPFKNWLAKSTAAGTLIGSATAATRTICCGIRSMSTISSKRRRWRDGKKQQSYCDKFSHIPPKK